MAIDCLWVSGQFKGHGYSNLLLGTCIEDSRAKGKKGLVILSSKKKLGFLSDPGYMRHKGFVTADTMKPISTQKACASIYVSSNPVTSPWGAPP